MGAVLRVDLDFNNPALALAQKTTVDQRLFAHTN